MEGNSRLMIRVQVHISSSVKWLNFFFFLGSLQVYFVLSNLTPLGLIWSDYIAVIQLSYHYHLFRL